MDYKEKQKEIIEIVEKIENLSILKYLLLVIKSYLKNRGIYPLFFKEEIIWRTASLFLGDKVL